MKYRRINEATVQCIITEDDMLEYGLTLSDIFERNEKGEEFLRDIIERAHDEVGYKIGSGNIAMQITPLKDKGLVLTFTDDSPAAFKNILEHLRDVLTGVGAEISQTGSAVAGGVPVAENDDTEIGESAGLVDYNEVFRMFVFPSLYPIMQFAASIPSNYPVKAHLYKEGDEYYLLLEKGRLSAKNFNKFSAQAVEFGNLISVSQERLDYLEEHGECLIKDRAVTRLRKIYTA